jgi:hypothetical protein
VLTWVCAKAGSFEARTAAAPTLRHDKLRISVKHLMATSHEIVSIGKSLTD